MRQQQRGRSTLGMLLMLCLGLFLLMFGMKTVPFYFDDRFYVQPGLKKLARGSGSIIGSDPKHIRQVLSKYMQMNNVRSAAANPKNWKITQDGEDFTVVIDYTVKNKLFGNLELLMHFQHRLDTVTPELCCHYRD